VRRVLLELLDGRGVRREEALLLEGGLPALGERAWRILAELDRRPLYPLELAKRLNISPQLAYYHVRRLARLGLIKRVEAGKVKGARYSKYAPSAGYLVWRLSAHPGEDALRRFFREYIEGGTFQGLLVVGSPDPHGPFKSVARDGHYAAALALALGGLCAPPSHFPIRLDVDVRARGLERGNLVLIGGPGVNLITMDVNPYLPVQFAKENYWAGLTKGNSAVYGDDVGLIAKIVNPWSPSSKVIVLAGVRSPGTKAAIIGLVKRSEELLVGYEKEPFVVLVRGFDMDGDGEVDDVEPISL
jgi:DNA-binding transcriptional ArsR family regulator